MKAIARYLDELIDQGTVKNDSDTARKLNLSRATVSKWRSGDRAPDDEEAVRLADLLGKEAGELLAECGAARAKTPATRQAWERIAARMAMSITLCALIIHPSQSQAAEGHKDCNLLFSEQRKRRKNKGLAQKVRSMTECIKVITYYVLQLTQGRFYSAFPALLGQS